MPPKLPACGFAFAAKYEGTSESIPVPQMKVKKVSKGKRITVVYGAVGSRLKAIATLKQLLGVGGELCVDDHTAIELQGDQTKRIPVVLKNIGALVCDEQPTNKPVKVERTNYQYDKFMKKSETCLEVASDQPVSDACILVHGKFWPYCNGHCQYCPPLTDVFEGLEQYCSWFENGETKAIISSKPTTQLMTREEIYSGFSSLGMTAEVGAAVKQYEQDKKRSVVVKPQIEKSRPVVVQPRRILPSAPPARRSDPNTPVRVIMNHLHDEDDEWFVLKISMIDRSCWVSDYEEFIHSLVTESTSVAAAAQIELIDSRTLRLRFWTGQDRDACKILLAETMEGILEFSSSDAVIAPEEEIFDESVESSYEPSCQVEFQRIAEELGLESNDEFWEIFCNLIDVSDGSTEGVARAFSEAVLRVLAFDDSPTS